MTKILPFKHPNVDDYKNSPDWFKTFLQQHASFIDTMNTVLQGNVDVTNNMQAEAQQVFFQSGVPFNVSLSKLDPSFQQPTMAFMGYVADGQVVTGCNITMYNADHTVQITCNLQGSPVGTFTGMLLLLPVTPNPGPVPLIAQPTGTPAGAPGGGGSSNTISLTKGALALTGDLLSGVNQTNRLTCPNTPISSQWEKFGGITVATGNGPVAMTIGPLGTGGALGTTPQPSVLVASATMCLSFFWDASPSNLYLNYHHGATNATNATPFKPSPLGETNRYYDTFTVIGTVSSGDNVAITNFDPGGTEPASSGNISQIQLEVGSTPTPYTDPNGCPQITNGRDYAIGIYPAEYSTPGNMSPNGWVQVGLQNNWECCQTYCADPAGGDIPSTLQRGGFAAPAALSIFFVSNPGDMGGAASGSYDSRWTTLAGKLNSFQSQIFAIRPGWEMNTFQDGGWFPWGGTGNVAPTYAAAFRRFATIIRNICPWCLIDWSGNGPMGPDQSMYYPGDYYCDYAGLDVYEQNVGGGWTNMKNVIDWAVNFGQGTFGANAAPGPHGEAATGGKKMLSIGEWSPAFNNNTGTVVTNFAAYFDALGEQAGYHCYFSAEGDSNNLSGAADLLNSGSSNIRSAYASLFNKPYNGTTPNATVNPGF